MEEFVADGFNCLIICSHTSYTTSADALSTKSSKASCQSVSARLSCPSPNQ